MVNSMVFVYLMCFGNLSCMLNMGGIVIYVSGLIVLLYV